MGMTTMRVFLHDALWQQDAPGFKKRIGIFLAIAARHGIKPLLVLFDSCWDPNLQTGPAASAHSRRAQFRLGAGAGRQGAGRPRAISAAGILCEGYGRQFRQRRPHPGLGCVERAGQSRNGSTYPDTSQARFDHVALLLPRVFEWARSVDPSQPLTSGIWHHDHWERLDRLNAVEKTQLTQSDVISLPRL